MPFLKRTLHWIGACLALGGVAIVMVRLYDEGFEVDLISLSILNWPVVSGLALAYGLSNSFLALAWRHLLMWLGTASPRCWAMRIYGLSQIAKYLPGNIFHLAGRQALGMAAGAPGWCLAKSTVWELGLIAVTGTCFGLLALPLIIPSVSVPAAIVLWMFALVSLAWLLGHFGGAALAWALGLQVTFLVVSGAVFVVLVDLVTGSPGALSTLGPAVAGAYTVAWLAGLVTPGAPAGVGVREIVLLTMLSSVLTDGDVLVVIVLGRLVTLFGDLAFFGAAILIRCGRKPLTHQRLESTIT